MPEVTRAHAVSSAIRRLASATGGVDPHGGEIGDDVRAVVQASESRQQAVIAELADALCELALQPSPDRARLGQQLIFTSVVEPLADSFDPELARVYDQLFARIIERCLQHPSGQALSALLARFGVSSSETLLARKARLQRRDPLSRDQCARVRRVFVPSRVTVGADVAVTSIVLQKAARVFPNAEIIVLGPPSARDILRGSAERLRFVDCAYARHGTLITRLEAWVQLVAAVDRERGTLAAGEYLFVDPDSRLTQLGLLPVVEEEVPSLLFESRSIQRPGAETLGELTARWLADTLGSDDSEPLYPKVVVAEPDAVAAREVLQRSGRSSTSRVTTVTLGVGGNAQKRLTGAFELSLVRALLAEGGTVILDKGIGEEVARVETTINALVSAGVRAIELQSEPLSVPQGAAFQLLIYQGGLRSLIALVAASDLYVGYDSAFQHIAGALAVPTVDVFVNAPSEHFASRWQPWSKAPVEVVAASAGQNEDEVLARVLAACHAVRPKQSIETATPE